MQAALSPPCPVRNIINHYLMDAWELNSGQISWCFDSRESQMTFNRLLLFLPHCNFKASSPKVPFLSEQLKKRGGWINLPWKRIFLCWRFLRGLDKILLFSDKWKKRRSPLSSFPFSAAFKSHQEKSFKWYQKPQKIFSGNAWLFGADLTQKQLVVNA